MIVPVTADDRDKLEKRMRLVADAPTDRFDELLRIAGLDPSRDLRFMDWSEVDFSGCDLRGYDFTGASLTGCTFKRARVVGARFDAAQMDRRALANAWDWDGYVSSWRKLAQPPGDRHLPDLAVFSDAPFAPEMVALPAGSFLMGSPDDQKDRYNDEGPQHRVTIGYRFALGRYAVTFDEYDRFCEATGAKKPSDENWGRGRRPVIHVSWDDARAYCAWLAKEIGKPYRLPSEAEWEYACRAGTTTRYSFGDDITTAQANFGMKIRKTTEVGAYPANPWGLFDMHGNVWERVEDVWHGDYKGAPADGSAWLAGGGQAGRVSRGGSWNFYPRYLRSANRVGAGSGNRHNDLGFRLARTLLPL